MQGIWRRVVYVSSYELIAILCTSIILMLFGSDPAAAGVAGVVTSVIAVLWNLIWNIAFEWWESKQRRKGRSLARRVAHAIGFEGGIALLTIPFFALWFGVSLWEAFLMEVGVLAFFLVYTFVFNWTFDRIFGLPKSAQPAPHAQADDAPDATVPDREGEHPVTQR